MKKKSVSQRAAGGGGTGRGGTNRREPGACHRGAHGSVLPREHDVVLDALHTAHVRLAVGARPDEPAEASS